MPEFDRDDYPVRPSVQIPKGSTERVRQATAELWASANPILELGEQGYERDTKTYKIGDGVTAWNALTAIAGGSGGGGGGGGAPLVFADTVGYTTLEVLTFAFDTGANTSTPSLALGGIGPLALSGGIVTVKASGLYRFEPRISVTTAGGASIGPSIDFNALDKILFNIPITQETQATQVPSGFPSYVFSLEAGSVIACVPGGSAYAGWSGLSIGASVFRLM